MLSSGVTAKLLLRSGRCEECCLAPQTGCPGHRVGTDELQGGIGQNSQHLAYDYPWAGQREAMGILILKFPLSSLP